MQENIRVPLKEVKMKTKSRNCCKNCVHYDSFFGSCNLYYEEVYIEEGEFQEQPVRVERISEAECECEVKNEHS